jgi:hypothetical protein
MNGHTPLTKQDSKSAAIVELNSLSEDDQHINLADHDGKNSIFLHINLIFEFI